RHRRVAAAGSLVHAADERRQHVGGGEVEVVARAVEVRWHRRDVGAAVLTAQRLYVHDAGDLRDGVRVVGLLQRTGEQGVLPDRLRGEAGVDAARAEEEQPRDAELPGGVDHIELDAQVVGEEVCGGGGVGHDATDAGGG